MESASTSRIVGIVTLGVMMATMATMAMVPMMVMMPSTSALTLVPIGAKSNRNRGSNVYVSQNTEFADIERAVHQAIITKVDHLVEKFQHVTISESEPQLYIRPKEPTKRILQHTSITMADLTDLDDIFDSFHSVHRESANSDGTISGLCHIDMVVRIPPTPKQ
jgi:hypothetical protein